MSECIFCKIILKKIPSYTIWEDEVTQAILDIFPSTDGHVVVFHKRHEETLLGYTSLEIQQLFAAVQKVANAVEKAFDTKILSIGINHGEPKGVHHTHVHVMPRYEGDSGGIIQSLPGRKPNDDLVHVAEKIKGVF